MTNINLKFRNLLNRADQAKPLLGRDDELRRLVQILVKPNHHHTVITGKSGVGKSSLVTLLAQALSANALPGLADNCFELETAPIFNLLVAGENPQSLFQTVQSSLEKLPPSIIVLEDIQLLAASDPTRLEQTVNLLQTIATLPQIRLIATTTRTTYESLFHNDYSFERLMTPLHIDQLSGKTVHTITAALFKSHGMTIDSSTVGKLIKLADRYGNERALPDTSLRLAEDIIAQNVFSGAKTVTDEDVSQLVAERENIPLSNLNSDTSQLKNLSHRLNEHVIGQASALRAISRSIIKNELGLGHDNRPRGSFLLLGPSGVGKTETAKALTEIVFQNPSALTRLDMSEYSESHSAIRLTGSPPGYTGYEEGGQLTGAVQKQPYSLILLDEIEKAHPKLFDVFLQVLDDGRLTDAKGRTADFTHTMIMATSNIGSQLIAEQSATGTDVSSPEFLHQQLMPLLFAHFRPEFINRFDAILVYQPLSLDQLADLADRELAKLAKRLAKHQITFAVPKSELRQRLAADYNPLFGARPVRRMIADHFEMPIAERIVSGELTAGYQINGSESWLE